MNKKINIIATITMILSIILCLTLIFIPKENVETKIKTFEYPEKLFNLTEELVANAKGEYPLTEKMIEIDIQIDEESWQSMLDNATNEEYVSCDVMVNGTKFETIGIRPKGNSSLSMVAGSDSDRFSFKLQFDEYIEGQTCYGLDQLALNNMQADYTYMKEYIAYDLMEYMGVSSPLVNYAHITVNGEEWGLYLALECYEESFLERNYGTLEGNLYSVKKDMGRGNEQTGVWQGISDMEEGNQSNIEMNPKTSNDTEAIASVTDDVNTNQARKNQLTPPDRTGILGSIGGGGSLVYTDNNSESYSSIFNNSILDTSNEEDYQKMITALEKLSKGDELETYFNIDQILRYFAVHTAVVNTDSYISNMEQNYYLYEEEGKVTILPWDYNLAFGGFQGGDGGDVVNFPIDTPVSGVNLEDRPLIAKLLEVPEYKEKYHDYLQEIVDYMNSTQFETLLLELDEFIGDDVKKDATAFCTYEQYLEAVDVLTRLCKLRAKSIQGQLDGSIPSTTNGQSDSSTLVDAEGINLSVMGGHSRGGSGFEERKFSEKPTHIQNRQGLSIVETEVSGDYYGFIWIGISMVAVVVAMFTASIYKRR